MNYSKEDYEFLKTIEDKLYTAVYCQFVRLSNRGDMVKADEIYRRVFHTDKGIIGGCSHCVYEACKKLGKLYFEDKKAYEKAEKEQNIEKEAENEPKKAPKAKKMSDYTYGEKKTAKNNNKKK